MKGKDTAEANFIKDADCTKDTPVVYGRQERPVYSRQVRFRPRVPGKRKTATDKKSYLPRLLPLENYDLIIVLFSGGKAIEEIKTGFFPAERMYTENWRFPAGAFGGAEGGPC